MPFCLFVLCATVSHCARVSREMAQFVLKMSDLNISRDQPHYWKRGQLQSPTTIMGPVRILLLLLYRRLLVRNRMYTWLNKRCVLLLNISNKQKKLTTFLIQIERRRSHVEAAQFCWFVAPCQNELINVCSWKNDLWNKTASSIWVQFDKTFNLQV